MAMRVPSVPAAMSCLDDPPCDFRAFVAERRGIPLARAGRLIASWLAEYEPQSAMPKRSPRHANGETS